MRRNVKSEPESARGSFKVTSIDIRVVIGCSCHRKATPDTGALSVGCIVGWLNPFFTFREQNSTNVSFTIGSTHGA